MVDFKTLRKDADLSVRDAAIRLGIKTGALYKYESSYRLPRWETLKKMKEIYNVDILDIVKAYDNHREKNKRRG